MSRDSGTEDEHYEEESMMSHIDYDESTSNDDLMELYTDIGSSSMEDMDIYTDNFFPCMDVHEYLSRMELDRFHAMQEAAHSHQQAMTFPKSRGTFYDCTSSRPRYSPSSSRRRHKHKNGDAHAPQHHMATQGRHHLQVLKRIGDMMQTPIRRTRHLRQADLQASHHPRHRSEERRVGKEC